MRSALAKPVRWIWSVRGAMLLCGALLVLAFPAANLEFLAWFGLVPGLVLIVRSPTAREGGIRAWWLGTGYLIAALYWMAPEIGPAVLLVGAVFGVLWVPFGMAAATLLRPPLSWPRALAALVVVPGCWVLTEWLRSWQALGGPWAVFGVSQWQHPAVLALAAVGGVWLVSFALVMTNVAIVIVIESLPRVGAALLPGASWRAGLAALGAAAVVATATAAPSTAMPGRTGLPSTRGSAPMASTIATFASTSAKLISHTPPTAANASTAGCCHWLTPNTAHGPPSACQDRSHSVSSQQLGTTTSAASARGQLSGGRSSVHAATPNGTHSTPTTAPTSSTAGPISGAIQ